MLLLLATLPFAIESDYIKAIANVLTVWNLKYLPKLAMAAELDFAFPRLPTGWVFELVLEAFNGLADCSRNAVPSNVNVGNSNPQRLRDVRRAPFLKHNKVEDLNLFWIKGCFHPIERGLEEVFAPLRFEQPTQIGGGGVWHTVDDRCAIRGIDGLLRRLRFARGPLPLLVSRALPELIPNSPTRLVQQPGLEATRLGIIAVIGQVPRHGNSSILNHLIGFCIGQARSDRKIVHQFAVDPVKLAPTFGVISLLKPG